MVGAAGVFEGFGPFYAAPGAYILPKAFALLGRGVRDECLVASVG